MKKLFKYLKGYERETVLGPLFKLFEASLELVVPLVIAAIVDYGIGGGNHSYVLWMSLLLVLLGVIGLAFSVTAQYFAAKASVGFVTKVRHALFEHSQSLSYSDLDTIGTSTLITRMTTDTSRVQSGLNLALRLLLRSLLICNLNSGLLLLSCLSDSWMVHCHPHDIQQSWSHQLCHM